MKIGCKIESVVGVNFKKLLTKIMNLTFKYILNSYFIECDRRCYKLIHPTCLDFLIKVLLIIYQQAYTKKKEVENRWRRRSRSKEDTSCWFTELAMELGVGTR